MRIDYDKYRHRFSWIIKDTEQSIFHIDSCYENNDEIKEIINQTPIRLLSVADSLNIDLYSIKQKEKRQKYNYWFFSPQLFSVIGITPKPSFKATGCASSSGIDYFVYNDSWANQTKNILHEEAHLLTMCEVGEAPAFFNEGIAVYCEAIISYGKHILKEQCREIWNKNIANEKGLFINLFSNTFFDDNLGKLPLYRIGAATIFYIVENQGIEMLKKIFAETHYNDTNFLSVIESNIGMTVEIIEKHISDFYM